MMTRVDATAHSRLSPGRLFDLLADPRGCMTWHDHAEKDRPQDTDAPPGLALAGAEYWTRGLCGKIPWRARTIVTTADRSRQYATESETIFSAWCMSALIFLLQKAAMLMLESLPGWNDSQPRRMYRKSEAAG